jgi:hypothetical protein
MTDYKHFPKVIRPQISDRQANRLFFILLSLLLLVTLSLAGREDRAAQAVIDKQALLEHTKQTVNRDEQAALHFYNNRTRP